MNASKSAEIQRIVLDAGFQIDKIVKDYAGLERIIIATK
jgi:methylase of polypeptide subunit release factors